MGMISAGLSAASVNAALGYTAANAASVVAKDNGVGAVGSFCCANAGSAITSGSTVSGSSLTDSGAAPFGYGGTWRNVSGTTSNAAGLPAWQRIA